MFTQESQVFTNIRSAIASKDPVLGVSARLKVIELLLDDYDIDNSQNVFKEQDPEVRAAYGDDLSSRSDEQLLVLLVEKGWS